MITDSRQRTRVALTAGGGGGDDDRMSRACLVALLLLLTSGAASGQALGVLHVKAVVRDAAQTLVPVARHTLLISDDPPSAPPRAVVTGREGTVDVRLRPGNYIIESERPVTFEGKAYQWTQRVAVVAGGDAHLELTAENADADTLGTAAPSGNDPSFLFPQWQGSVMAVWTPTTQASGFLIDPRGLIVTAHRIIGNSSSVEVQLTPEIKVAGRVLAADAMRDVAVLWIDPAVTASVRPVPLGCEQTARPAVAEGEELFTIGAPRREQKRMTSGAVTRLEPRTIIADLRLVTGSAGGPVFNRDGAVVGITSPAPDDDESRRWAARVVRVEQACAVIASAEQAMQGSRPPSAALLPVDPTRTIPEATLAAAAKRRAGNLTPPQMSSADFDIAFITPALVYGADKLDDARGRGRGTIGGPSDALRPLREFSNWSDYVGDYPPVLMIRITPKLVERFWAKVARGAAQTQGVALPPIKRFAAGFDRMRAFCGEAELTPIHPFKLEQRVGDNEAIYEGLYVFAQDAFGRRCGSVKLVLYSDKEPDKGDARVVDSKLIEALTALDDLLR
jgi:S1-C subfamily serine protease